MDSDRRRRKRKAVESINIVNITSFTSCSPLADKGQILDASADSLLLMIHRNDFTDQKLQQNLSLDNLLGERILFHLPQMNIEIDGTIARTKHIGGGKFELVFTFANHCPEYWRECLVDLLPYPGEFED